MYMNFNTITQSFCEGKINGIPEYFNCCSSIFISIISLRKLIQYNNININPFILKIYYLFFLNGIASFLLHWTLFYGWKMFDEYIMIIMIWSGCYSMIYYVYRQNNKINKYSFSYLLHTYNILLLECNIFSEFHVFFPIFFGLECLFIIFLYYKMQKKYRDYNKQGIHGIFISILSGIIWFSTELFCNKYLILGHSIWHIGMPIGIIKIAEYVHKSTSKKILLI